MAAGPPNDVPPVPIICHGESSCWHADGLLKCHVGAAQGAWVTEKVFKARPVSAELFSERIDKVDAATGAAIVAALKGAGLVNATGFLIQDPRYCLDRIQCLLHAPDFAHRNLG